MAGRTLLSIHFRSDMSRKTAIHPMTRTLTHSFRTAIAVTAALASGGCAISQANEIEMGAKYAAEVEKELVLVNDPDAIGYINLLGQTLVRVGDTRGLTWHFSIVNSN